MDIKLPINQHVDILAIGTHPLDVEIGVGGVLLKMAHRGYTTVICDLTQGEIDTIDPLDNQSSAPEKAAKILQVSDRINLGLGGSSFDLNMDQSQILAQCLSLYSPDIILAPYWEDWNPSRCLANQLIHKAINMTTHKKKDKTFKTYKSSWVFYYPFSKPTIPQAIVNITSTFEGKMEAVKAYQTKFKEMPLSFSPSPLSFKDFIFHVESRARHYGSLINCRFGEGMILDRPLPLEDICEFVNI